MRLYDLVNKTLNPMMRATLRSPFHGIASGTLGILHYEGRRSGRPYEVPLSYVRDVDDQGRGRVRFLSSHNTRWWFNFRTDEATGTEPGSSGTPVVVELARERLSGTATLFEEDGEALRRGVLDFLTALPRDASIYGIGLDAQRRPREADIDAAGGHVVLVEVALD